MRYALPASVVIHLTLLGSAWLALNWTPPPEETGFESVNVNIVSLEEFTSTAGSMVQSSAIENLVAAGAQAVEEVETVDPVEVAAATPVKTEPTEIIEPETATPAEKTEAAASDPVKTAEVTPQTAPEADPVETESLAVLAAAPRSEVPIEGLTPLTVSPTAAAVVAAARSRAEPIKLAAIRPVVVSAEPLETLESVKEIVPGLVAPTPHTRPDFEKKRPEEAKKEPERAEPVKTETPKKKPTATGGNGGEANANVAAAAASGGKGQSNAAGNAAVSKYPGLVQRALRRALRFPKGAGNARGEVQVTFVVSASGRATQITVTRSSGHAVLDREAVATVKRAAPFPPIPEGADRKSWTFTMPLAFQR